MDTLNLLYLFVMMLSFWLLLYMILTDQEIRTDVKHSLKSQSKSVQASIIILGSLLTSIVWPVNLMMLVFNR